MAVDHGIFIPSTIDVRLSAVRKMVGKARRAGMIGQEEAVSLTDIPYIRQKGITIQMEWRQ